MREEIAPEPEVDMSWVDLVCGHFDFPKTMGEDDHIEKWKRELEVTAVRVQRLQEISDDDALAEGVTKVRDHCYVIRGIDYDEIGLCHSGPIAPFAKLWDSLNAERGFGWDQNPWVIALTFVVHQQNVDQLLAARKAA
jgi:hypothetical protein